jgi:SAM-dependent methyltransferase
MDRVAEPELMDDEAQALAYANADFEDANSGFCGHVHARLPSVSDSALVVDLGCGPADIPVRLARRHPGWHFDAVDGAPAMLATARLAVDRAGLGSRIALHLARLPDTGLNAHAYDLVLSNSLLHHLGEPGALLNAVRVLGRPGAGVLVMDLRRPDSEKDAADLVERYSPNEPPVLKRDFYRSLLAAYRPDEVRAALGAAGLHRLSVDVVSDRHLLIWGRLD